MSLKLTVLADNSLLQESFMSLFVNINVYLLDQRLHLVHGLEKLFGVGVNVLGGIS